MTTAAEPHTPETWVPKIAWGDRIRIVRRGLDLSQEQFAALLGIGKQRLSAWESGSNRPADAVEMAQLIQERTGVPATWMLGLDTSGARSGMGRAVISTYITRSRGPRTRLHRPDRIPVAIP